MDYKVTDTELTGIADAIRMKGETAAPLTFPNGFTSAINAIPTGGIIPTGTKNITANGDYDVESYASAHVSVSGITPSGTYSITNNGIYDILSYASVDVNVSGGEDSRFEELIARRISGIVNISGSLKIGMYAFYQCSLMSALSASNVTDIEEHAFDGCSRLEEVYIGSAFSASNSAFAYCSSLRKVVLPTMVTCGSYVFTDCVSLTDVSLPQLGTLGIATFNKCLNLSMISLPKASIIQRSAFASCYHLLSLYLMSNSRVYLNNSSAFNSTPIGGYTASTGGVYGSIFVPASLYSDYLTANYWSLYSDRFVSV